MVFSTALTKLNISFKNEFSEVESNLKEIAPSLSRSRLGLIDVALMKFVDSKKRCSFYPLKYSPSMIKSTKLLSTLESLV